ncbi:MAG: RNA-directed DNA polymerase [Verrucomicrobia bacterium]|nr:RNA-directed DNA polymerase [Verrucomicrobiota bacterium]
MKVRLEQLYNAYRKAKKDAFGDTNCAHGLKIADYEQKLSANLIRLQKKLNQRSSRWQTDFSFLGAVTCIPKSVKAGDVESDASIHYQSSDPLEQWKRQCRPGKDAVADFRPVINATVDFMVISALWILEVGHLYEAKLDTRYAVGNRLKRWRPRKGSQPGETGKLNLLSPDLFQPYFSAYGKWRSAGLKAMRRELKEGRRVVAVTMDLKRFYHQVDASFLLHKDYLDEMDLTLTPAQKRFTQKLITAISTWNEVSHLHYNGGTRGLPVGLSASGLIANVLLRQFDSGLVNRIQPAHYARYVDDVFLVIHRSRPFADGRAFMRWLGQKLGPLATAILPTKLKPFSDGPSLKITLGYADGSELLFVGKKQKIFQLKGQHGIDMIGPIEEQIRKQSSEFRDLPDLPDSEREMAFRALLVTSDATLDADALRKADAVTLRRSGFAMLLGDVEAHARDIDPKDTVWRRVRHEFYGLAQRHLITPPAFFDFARYYPRVLGLMAGCGDWEEAKHFLNEFVKLLKTLRKTCGVKHGNINNVLDEACCNLGIRIIEAVLRSVFKANVMTRKLLAHIRQSFRVIGEFPTSVASISRLSRGLARADWAKAPYWSTWVSATADAENIPSKPRSPAIREALRLSALDELRRAANLRMPLWTALAFPTRPLPVSEITSRAPGLLKDGNLFSSVVMGIRGTWMPEHTPLSIKEPKSDDPQTIKIPYISHWKPKVAITSLEVEDNEWKGAVKGKPLLSLKRYRRLAHLLDAIIGAQPHPNYVVLPELCLPRAWAMTMVNRLAGCGISVIAGLEYRHDSTNQHGLHNEALIVLRTTYPGYETSLFLLQPKQQAAWHERQELSNKGSKFLIPPTAFCLDRPVFSHQGFCFGVLICSELTDIRNRSHFQGKVDVLFVPEWNQDIESFTALIESAALDVHAYIVQANNRRFGDSRMRAPMKEHFKRDLVRVKGGLNDYFVIGAIDYSALRDFQSHATPPSGKDVEFKPFPIGFPSRLSAARRTTPL